MEKENKRKVTPDINEEMMMNLMVDGVKRKAYNFHKSHHQSRIRKKLQTMLYQNTKMPIEKETN